VSKTAGTLFSAGQGTRRFWQSQGIVGGVFNLRTNNELGVEIGGVSSQALS